jgi:hypothetical protein
MHGVGPPRRHHGLAAGGEQADRFVGREHRALHRFSHDDGVFSPGGSGAQPVPPQRPTDRVVDRDEAVGELVERLGHAVDVAGPESPSRVGVTMAAFVVEVPTRQRRVVQRQPVAQPRVAGRPEDVAIAVERVVVELPLHWLDPGPLDGQSPVGAAERGELTDVVRVVLTNSETVGRSRRELLALPLGPVGCRGHALGRDR